MSKAARVTPLLVALASFAACGAMMWFGNDVVVWLHIVVLAATFAILSGPDSRPLHRAGRALIIGAITSIALVTIALVVGWITDRRHFFDDGGPLAFMLVIEAYVGLPAALLGAILGGFASPTMRLASKYMPRRLA